MRLRLRALNRRKIGTSAPPIPPIYGLRFDGINDFLERAPINYSGNYEIGFTLYRLQVGDNGTYAEILGNDNNNRFFQIPSAGLNYRTRKTSVNVDFFVTDFGLSTTYFDGEKRDFVFGVEAGQDFLEINGVRRHVAGARNFILSKIGVGGSLFANMIITEAFDSNGNVWNDANNWVTWTNNGATRVVSTDGGVTWQTA